MYRGYNPSKELCGMWTNWGEELSSYPGNLSGLGHELDSSDVVFPNNLCLIFLKKKKSTNNKVWTLKFCYKAQKAFCEKSGKGKPDTWLSHPVKITVNYLNNSHFSEQLPRSSATTTIEQTYFSAPSLSHYCTTFWAQRGKELYFMSL